MSTVYDRIFGRMVETENGCWEWQGKRGHVGHGLVQFNGRGRLVHRLVWEFMRGPIPDGLELDHLCRNPPCCNPDHLDPVTHAENMRRGIQSFATRTHCLSGLHELTPENVTTNSTTGRNRCRECRNANSRARRARLRESA